MDKLKAMTVFVEIAESGSLTAAAEKLGRSLPAVVRLLAALEQQLQVRLFNRTTRRIALTEEGRHYLQHCQKILCDIDEVEQSLVNDQVEPSGTITLTAPVRFGEMYVNPAIVKYLKQHPQIHINLLLLDRVVNMLEEGIDLAVRIAHIGDSSVIAKPLGNIRRVICASPELLKQHGVPQRPESFRDFPCILFSGFSSGNKWYFQNHKKRISVNIKGPYKCNQVSSSVESCVSGLGFGQFLSYQVMPWVKQGRLKIILSEYEPEPLPVSIVFHHSRLMPPRVRMFVDFLNAELRQALNTG
ncbi:Transcriptional regulator, LysR family [hydrothermal vent metagenome]|uniref:Transcriptional regulator, LysR family n=1 Tax=hydrothermal vent metagenome TaxID=652676 RepID=A0A3B0XGX6_9ZZZZ